MQVSVLRISLISGVVLTIAGAVPASATTVNFTFIGTQASSANAASTATPQTLTGSISFSYSGNSNDITLSDLTSFSATASLSSSTSTWTFSSVNDLSNFSYQNGTKPFLSFVTTSVPSGGSGGSSIASGAAGSAGSISAYLSDTGNNTVDLSNSNHDLLGFGSLLPVPEPANCGLLAIGMIPLAIFGVVRRRGGFSGR